ncbi:hypothetical protein Ct61P_14708 [Colletotrichum tofieldiae]|nr:hypothetical protein Ct61P_14708 [Colletotrichum tofieldiae]
MEDDEVEEAGARELRPPELSGVQVQRREEEGQMARTTTLASKSTNKNKRERLAWYRDKVAGLLKQVVVDRRSNKEAFSIEERLVTILVDFAKGLGIDSNATHNVYVPGIQCASPASMPGVDTAIEVK